MCVAMSERLTQAETIREMMLHLFVYLRGTVGRLGGRLQAVLLVGVCDGGLVNGDVSPHLLPPLLAGVRGSLTKVAIAI